mmetsp:Transcript_67786/g.219026  ORF Transcript_67786/g.219026 Transcript_67786/m.219026 type:complete len:228 (-) Transcript_67786:44-727(-)
MQDGAHLPGAAGGEPLEPPLQGVPLCVSLFLLLAEGVGPGCSLGQLLGEVLLHVGGLSHLRLLKCAVLLARLAARGCHIQELRLAVRKLPSDLIDDVKSLLAGLLLHAALRGPALQGHGPELQQPRLEPPSQTGPQPRQSGPGPLAGRAPAARLSCCQLQEVATSTLLTNFLPELRNGPGVLLQGQLLGLVRLLLQQALVAAIAPPGLQRLEPLALLRDEGGCLDDG